MNTVELTTHLLRQQNTVSVSIGATHYEKTRYGLEAYTQFWAPRNPRRCLDGRRSALWSKGQDNVRLVLLVVLQLFGPEKNWQGPLSYWEKYMVMRNEDACAKQSLMAICPTTRTA